MTEILIAALFAASLHFLTGLAGMTSFGHAAWLGLGAYGAALLLKLAAVPMEAALLLGPFAAAFGAPLPARWMNAGDAATYAGAQDELTRPPRA
ncbi:hypothetical protein G6F24_016985 [Rhizopus arrhizus]|nr:hypothetical protein G6F24_016985 [Rhizopus arrhizus]